ncbi:MAG: glycosyltransferase family 4 protein [Oscillatoriophycideae cyanobacterium NC_groundwater_1537_Pr4_S-0.65um_50_18]|nr:glycosyltransferase family 4 protein [Oscillatoriophycideae cyanobacterium NC_groundwater_1537_Pr4_S-0.65um_50_18]
MSASNESIFIGQSIPLHALPKPASVVCCTVATETDWRWFADEFPAEKINWYFTYCKSTGILKKLIKRPDLAKVYSSLQAVKLAKEKNADLLISHEAELTFWCALFGKLLGMKTEHIAYAFNYPFIPNFFRRLVMTQALDGVSHFFVSSGVEKRLYQQYFKIPADKIDIQLWKMGDIGYAPEEPVEPGDYICALGQYGRDYATLMAAMERLPDIHLIVVAKPHNVAHLSVPPNVKLLTNAEGDYVMNILKFSRFMVLPLANSEMPAGHITLVSAMKLGKGVVITHSSGIIDYIQDGYTALTYEAADVDSLTQVLRDLWNDPHQSQRLGENAKQFAEEHCSEASAVKHLQTLLTQRGLLSGL